MDNMKSKVMSGLFWRFMERGGAQVVQFLVSIVLARVLLPEEYGLVAIITVFIAIANVFIDVGLTTALVQKDSVDQGDYCSVFYTNIALSLLIYLTLFLSAEGISKFYGEPLLVPILKVQSLSIIFGALNSVHNAIISRKMQFKKSFYRNLGGMITSAIVGITMAYSGFGVWSLVLSQLASSFMMTIILWTTVNWHPEFLFSIVKIKGLFRFGSKILCSGLLYTTFNNIYSLIIVKLFDGSMLGYYNRGQNIPSLIVNNINETISGVMFPALASCQNDKRRLKELLRRSMVTSCFLVFPTMIGLAAIAEPLTIILLTEKWSKSVPFMQIACVTFAFYPIHTANLQAISAIGRSDIYLKLEIIKKVLIVITIIISIPFGVYAIVAGNAVVSIISIFINSWPNKSLLDYKFREQMVDIIPSLLLSVFMGVVVMILGLLQVNIFIKMTIQMTVGVAVYILGAYLFKFECLLYLLNTIKPIIHKVINGVKKGA